MTTADNGHWSARVGSGDGRPASGGRADRRLSVANGLLEEGPGGALWPRVPADVSGFNRQQLVCRGLACVLYREAGARDGRVDYTSAIEGEIEYAATLLSAGASVSRRRWTVSPRRPAGGGPGSRPPENGTAGVLFFLRSGRSWPPGR